MAGVVDRVPVIFVEDPNETPQETLERLQKVTGGRLGLGRAFELVLPEIMLMIEKNWLTIIPMEFKASWIPQLKDNPVLREIPDLGPAFPQTNVGSEVSSITTDDPVAKTKESIRYRIVRTENAGFDRKMFSGTKELKPRRRFQIAQMGDNGLYTYTDVLAKTWEYLVEFSCNGKDALTSDFLYKCFEYILYTNAKLFYSFGLQRFIPLGSPGGDVVDPDTELHRRILSVYFRHEEFYFRKSEVEIGQLAYDWNDFQVDYPL